MTTPSDVEVRVATASDALDVRRLLDGAMLDVEALDARITEGHVLVAIDDGSAVGAIVLAPEGPPDGTAQPRSVPDSLAHVRAIAVRRRRRDQGIGTALVRTAVERFGPVTADFDPDRRPFYDGIGAKIHPAEADPDRERDWAVVRPRE